MNSKMIIKPNVVNFFDINKSEIGVGLILIIFKSKIYMIYVNY